MTVDQTQMPFRLDGRVAIVTGASAGLGRRFAHVLGRAGAHVVATARRADMLNLLGSEIGATTLSGDITEASVQ